MMEEIENKLKIISFLDKCRWECEENNYYTINYSEKIEELGESEKDLKMDLKLLTHWLSYITDRQMPFELIWDIGGYVFSELVYEYMRNEKSPEDLLKIGGNAFFKKDEKKEGSYAFAAPIHKKSDCRKRINKIDENDVVYFKSRYYTEDYISIYRTLYILEKISDKSFVKYIELILDNAKEIHGEKLNAEEVVKALANGLYFLTYKDGRKKKAKETMEKHVDTYKDSDAFGEIDKCQEKDLKDKLKEYIKERRMTRTIKNYENKRLWCSIRDYIKFNEFKGYLKEILKSKGIAAEQDLDRFFDEMKIHLELPGDVWNNNEKFRNCIFPKVDIERFNKYLRDLKNERKYDNIEWYPEQFDVTFNLASNLCSRDKCEICPLGKYKKAKMLCIGDECKNKGKYCPIIMNSCGYAVQCEPKFKLQNGCIIKDILDKK